MAYQMAWLPMTLSEALKITFVVLKFCNTRNSGNISCLTQYAIKPCPLSSDRQHLSCDVCLEVRGEIIRTALFYIVYWSCAQSQAHLDEQFLQFSGLGFVTLGPCHCAYCILYVMLLWAQWVDLMELKPNP